ncbi:MAG: YeeE/YedE family protein [Deltaproteobacteria bacterium]|nr:YeeE/YedE family protein [Deltaproteobacteria bacterium]
MKNKHTPILTRQWPFLAGGLLVGLGELIYYCAFGTFIPVTTGLAKMFSTVEANITHTQTISRLYSPDIHWVIIGALLGAWIVGRLEHESRNWVRYKPGMLLLALLGGMIFGFGTRIGPGCTTHHIFGGLAVMSIASFTIAITGLPFAFAAFVFVSKLGYGPYFKHQENKASVLKARDLGLVQDHCLSYDEHYRPFRNPVHISAWLVLAVLIGSSLYTGFFGESGQALGAGALLPNIVRFAAGLALGFGIAKSGVGTECGLMAPESLLLSEEHYKKLNIPFITQRMFQALMPVAGVLGAVLVLNAGVLIGWLFFGRPIPDAAPKPTGWGLHIGHLMAAPCLAIGSVFMIGCEIRSYGRIGLGYLTGMVGLIGFYLGYLPYVYYNEAIDGFIARHAFVASTNWVELLAGNNMALQRTVAIGYTLLLVALLGVVIRYGARRIGISARDYVTRPTDDVCLPAQSEKK